ncbi:cation transport protein [Bifidobacterium dolichotidis]|uniref:Cation transport protein n=1 Tax=Bifidobacterium dolichotidis TaxID=2306976 RepID=A0A430FTI1_9BIFI|nr:potassium transporter TrkG [Bifidobacterium dolichotidis]RSX56125.1 cation transport protein [Bifidobacterium dolichotidis]
MARNPFDRPSSRRSDGYAWWFSGDSFSREAQEERMPRKRGIVYRISSHPGQLTIIYFMSLIFIATSLLLTPAASSSGKSTPFSTAFFTAVSALSTCGISIVNTTQHWSIFGQIVLIVAVQMGGLGVMTFASMIALAVNHHLKATQRLLTATELGTNKLNEIRSVLNVVLTITFSIEAITFVSLFPGLLSVNKSNVGKSLWEALFFAVMAYNNAGFTPDGAGLYVDKWEVGMPIMLSAFCGTLGFPVILNLVRTARQHKGVRRLNLHTKVTLLTTFIIVLISLFWFLIVEWNNQALFHNAGIEERMRRGVVAAVMPRSSGFDLSWVPKVSEPTKVFMSMVMFIGGGSTSTAGGIRVTTLAVIFLVCKTAFSGHADVNVFHRRIHMRVVMTAISITVSCLALVFVASVSLMMIEDVSFSHALFDACSAFGLGGYSVGVADADYPAALYVLAATMIIGRLGPMTIAYAVGRPHVVDAVRYPTDQIVVG